MGRAVHEQIGPETFLTSHEAGRLIQANPSSINKWINEGRISAHRTPGGHRRIKAADFVAFLVKHTMPIPTLLQPVIIAPRAEPTSPPKAAKKTRKKR